ncbi:MAG TPA: S-layer homology domain-containing protein [bacterium]|jgi:hypothetical protein|nr:S-layer homology domain-containing protein [bacterium]
MKKVALAIAAVLVLMVVAPAFSQPFADVPTDHWAFDAIAELAAKGLIEGYPDGTFKGDRALTRYEMAMVIARVLARIEAIKIPPPPAAVKIPAPEVTRADIQTLQRLINEFRAELAALGVRVTAVEEELAALRARVDNTFITGDWTYIYSLGGNPSSWEGGYFPQVMRNRARLTFRGRVGSHTTVFLRARWNSRTSLGDTGLDSFVTDFDRVYFDYAAPFGVTFRVGRDYWGLGDNGILLVGLIAKEGVRATGSFGPLTLTALTFFGPPHLAGQLGGIVDCAPTTPGLQRCTTWATYAFRAQAALIPGWTFGVNFRADRCNQPNCGSFTQSWNFLLGAWTGTGWSFDWSGQIIPGLTLSGEWASYTPTNGCPGGATAFGVVKIATATGCGALFVNLAIDLGRITGMSSFSPMVNVWYKNYGAYYQLQQSNNFSLGGLWWGYNNRNVRAWGVDLSIVPVTNLTLYVGYENGVLNATNLYWNFPGVMAGDTYAAFVARAQYNLGHNSNVSLEYYNYRNISGNFFTSAGHLIESLYAVRLFHRW